VADSDTKQVLQQARERFSVALAADQRQRERELDDLRFDAGDQWPDDVKAQRKGMVVDGVPVPSRPMLTINKLASPVSLVVNQQRNAHLGINVHPDSEDATDDVAEVLQGLIRHIEVRSNASMARTWAFERAVKCGRGYYRILKRYVDDSGQDFDQELVVERILNQSSVYLDPYAQQADWSDAQWAFIGGWMPADRFKQEFPNATLSASDDGFETGTGDTLPDWMSEDDEGRPLVRVLEYFVVTKTPAERVAYVDAAGALVACWADEVPASIPPEAIQQRRQAERRSVQWYKLTGTEILEQQDWDGQYIPIIPVIGQEQNVDGDRRFIGIINQAKDAQRLFNYSVSTAVETEALMPKAPFIGYEGQFEGHEAAWAQANTRNFPYLQVKPTTIGGQPAPLPQRNVAGANLSPALALVQQADSYIKATTSVYDPSLGNTSPARSGRAVLALQQQADQANSNYLDNLAQVSMLYEARILLDLIPKVYDRPGRIARILGEDDAPKKVMLNAPFVVDGRGQPRQAPMPTGPMPNGAPAPAPMALVPTPTKAGNVKHYDLAIGRYSVTVNVGKSYQTRLQEGGDQVGQILQANPSLMPILGDIYFKFRDFPGHNEIAERLKKLAPPQLQLGKDAGNGPSVAQLQGQLQQQGQMLEQLTQQLNQASEVIKQDQVKTQAELQAKQMELQAKAQMAESEWQMRQQIAALQAETQLRLELLRAQSKQALQQQQVEANVQTREDAQAHDVMMAGVQAATRPVAHREPDGDEGVRESDGDGLWGV
jgi:hypothetical protein